MAVTRFIALSVAATGRSYTDGHRVTELWLQKVDGNSLGQALSLHFAKPKEQPVADHHRFADDAQRILDFIGDSTLVCHDAEYHIGYLNYELINAGFRTVNSPIICTLDLCRKQGIKEENPDIICRMMGLSPRGRSPQAEAYQAAAIYLSISKLPLPIFPPCPVPKVKPAKPKIQTRAATPAKPSPAPTPRASGPLPPPTNPVPPRPQGGRQPQPSFFQKLGAWSKAAFPAVFMIWFILKVANGGFTQTNYSASSYRSSTAPAASTPAPAPTPAPAATYSKPAPARSEPSYTPPPPPVSRPQPTPEPEVVLPQNAHSMYGSWECNTGYFRSGDRCVRNNFWKETPPGLNSYSEPTDDAALWCGSQRQVLETVQKQLKSPPADLVADMNGRIQFYNEACVGRFRDSEQAKWVGRTLGLWNEQITEYANQLANELNAKYRPEPTADLVMEVQRFLQSKGYLFDRVDGIMGPNTRWALKRFQSDQGLPQTGEITADVLSRMRSLR